jgi:small-conductance mechanosensitive channel
MFVNSSNEFSSSKGNLEKVAAALACELPNFLGILLFFGSAYVAYFTFIWTKSPFVQLFFLALLISITLIRCIWLLSELLFSPNALSLRLLPMKCTVAKKIHLSIVWASGYMILGLMFTVVAGKLGAQTTTINLLQLLFASVLLIAAATVVLLYKNRIQKQIISAVDTTDDRATASWGRKRFASLWHLPALVYLFSLWLLLLNDLIDPGQKHSGAFILSFFVLPIWMVADKLLQWFVTFTMATLKIYKEQQENVHELTAEDIEYRQRGLQAYKRTLVLARAVLVAALLVWVASLWSIRIPLFSNLTNVLFDAFIIMTIALIFWQFISEWIELKITESLPAEDESDNDKDDEWGTAAARGRSYTLLPMIRRFIGTILVTMVTMTILSSTGVDIGPLLAGAGVVGLAVGFGAQKLVADMFSGFFYLLDDAFRVGEYIEAGGISGTVESISLRNVMLRHHRGMLQIIPHSDLGAITNYMRGGIVVKFNLDFAYDADIDAIRKIIKKVGLAMLEDEEFGEDFIRPVKSQGVREITNSVMTIRVKFTARPGAHFVIRREAFKRITEALRAKGIQYAHKKVIVDLPAETKAADSVANAAGAAIQTALETDEKSKEDPGH